MLAKFVRAPGKPGSEVLRLPQVILQVVEFHFVVVVEFDEFPVAIPDGRSRGPGGAMIVRVVPVETAGKPTRLAVHEEILEALSIGVLRGAQGQAGESEEGGVDVRAQDTVGGL